MQDHSSFRDRLHPRYGTACVILLAILIHSILASTAFGQIGSPPQKGIVSLQPGEAIEREISGKSPDNYEITLAAGQYAGITVEQRGIDVAVYVVDPDGKVSAEFDSEARIQGEEHVGLTSESAGHYQLSVRAKYPRAVAGQYRIRVTEIRPATEPDRLWFEAHQLTVQAQHKSEGGNNDDARQLAARALEDAEKALGPKDPYVGDLLVKLAELERTKDNPVRAEELLQRAIAVDEAALGREHPQTAFALLRLGALYNALGASAKAEPLFQESLAITEKTLGNEHPRFVVCLMNVSALHMYREDYESALPELQRALVIAEKSLEPDDIWRIGVINNLADVYRSLKDYDRAEPLTEQTIELVEKKFGPDYPRLSDPLMNLAIIARERKQYPRALELLGRALAIREKAYGPRNSQTAAILITIGNVYRAEGEYEKALETYQRARDILEVSAGPYHSLTLLAYVNAAIAYAALGDVPHAIEYQTRADSVLEKSIELNLAIGSEREKFDYLSSASERTDRTVSLNALLAPGSPAATELAALVLLQRKGRVLDAMSDSMGAVRERLNSADQTLLDELDKTTAQLAKLSLHGAGKTPPEEYQKQLAALEEQREKLEADISRRSAEFRTQVQTVTVAAVQSAIPRQAALIEFATYRPFDAKADSDLHAYGEPHYIAYIFRQQGGIQWKDLGPTKAIDDAVAAMRKALRDPESKDVKQLARALDEKTMQPVRTLTGDATQLLISPDGELNLIPFEALADEHGQYLLERYSISYLTTGRDLLRMQVQRASKSGPVVIADPLFGEPTEMASTNPPKLRASRPVTARRSITTAHDLSGVYFAPLAGTGLEALAIKAQFPESQLLTGQRATESAIKQINAPSILHIATHGFFLEDASPSHSPDHSPNPQRGVQADAQTDNPLLRSGLALAGANLSHTGADKGILTALEASNLNLWGTKLVTLSACDTGVGEIRNGEGVYGLRRAFVLAGAESVVMSLWPVSDYTTRELMTSYYTGLKNGLGRGEALRQTKLAMLKHKDRRHPFYWASFIQSGDWATLDGHRE